MASASAIVAATILVSSSRATAQSSAGRGDARPITQARLLELARGEIVSDLLERMTLEEKLAQLTLIPAGEPTGPDDAGNRRWREWIQSQISDVGVGAVFAVEGAEWTNQLQRLAVEETRLGVPLIIGNDVIHGYRTIFPIPLATSGTFDMDLIEACERVAATEARAGGTHWTFAPMVDVARDPRWGRIAEGAGEDPFLGAAVAAARVRGFQGADLAATDTVMACAKHFAAYGAGEGGRDYDTVDISEHTLRSVHLPPFRAAVDAGAGSLMSAFNEVLGVPASGSELLLEQILRREWGFGGLVLSDWQSITEMIDHGYAADPRDAATKSLVAGVDVDLFSLAYREQLESALSDGLVSIETIDRAVRRVLAAKVACGLFDHPYTDEALEDGFMMADEHRLLARKAAGRSIVLLKNDDAPGADRPVLPLAGDERIAVIGPLAEARRDLLGTWAGFGREEEIEATILDAIRERAGADVTHARGCEALGDDRSGLDEAVALARDVDVAILVVGEPEPITGEGNSRSDITLPGAQSSLVRAVAETGTPVVVVLLNGRPLAIPELADAPDVPAILATFHLGTEHGRAVADVLFGDVNPSAKLTATWPRSVGQIPMYYAHKSTGRPFEPDTRYVRRYIDVPITPQYPFGHGLSYTTFAYGDLTVADPATGDAHNEPTGTIEVGATVTNTGDRAGAHVVQLYIRDEVASITRPVRQLRGFERVELEPGAARRVAFRLGPAELSFLDGDLRPVVEPGTFRVFVSRSAAPNDDEELTGTFEVRAPR